MALGYLVCKMRCYYGWQQRDRPLQAHMSRRFSDFLMVSSFFNSNNCSRSVLAKNWRLAQAKLHATGGQSHINFTRVAASRMQIVPEWLSVAWKLYPCGRQSQATWIKLAEICKRPRRYNLHVTDGHSSTICMRLAATGLQDKRQADKWCVKGHLYIIIIFV